MKVFLVVALLLFILILAFLFFTSFFIFVRVDGISMYPTYTHGEILLARKLRKREKLIDGKVYVFYPPYNDDPDYYVIKRLFKHNNQGLFFVGDNLRDSYDSRRYGYVKRDTVKYVLVHSRRKV